MECAIIARVVRLLVVATAAALVLACGRAEVPRDEAPQPSAPSAAAVRFAETPAGHADVGIAQLHTREAGKISLPNGQLAVSDAFINDSPLLVSDLGRGEYVVELLVAAAQSDERVAAARVRLKADPIDRWRLVGSIAVDSGTGAFFDPRVSASITASSVDRFSGRLTDALAATYRHTYAFAAMSWNDLTFVAFSTGFGDGAYPVFLGSSAAGTPVVVLVDCDILPWEK